jgi:hypothetical protein
VTGRHRRRGIDRARHELTVNARAVAGWLGTYWWTKTGLVLFGVFAIL